MLSVSEALAHILGSFQPVEAETCPLTRSRGRILAADIAATADLPAFDYSSMDGFALRSADLLPAGTPGWELVVCGEVRAGEIPLVKILPGQCARIMTGAPIPPGADAVVMFEDTDHLASKPGTKPPDKAIIHKRVIAGENIRPRGMDLKAGSRVLASGTRLEAREIALLASLGHSEVSVHRLVRLALFSSGDELIPPGIPLPPGKIYDSNTTLLTALAETLGTEVTTPGIARDSLADTRAKILSAVSSKPDAIISTAGVSMGAFDFIKYLLETEGTLDFWRVDMRPGKPLAFGSFKGIPYFGLPGNPVSAFVGFELFIKPAVQRLSGFYSQSRKTLRVTLAEEVVSDGRESYLRARINQEQGATLAHLTGHQGSGNLVSLVHANALLIVPSGVKCVPAGSELDAWLLE